MTQRSKDDQKKIKIQTSDLQLIVNFIKKKCSIDLFYKKIPPIFASLLER